MTLANRLNHFTFDVDTQGGPTTEFNLPEYFRQVDAYALTKDGDIIQNDDLQYSYTIRNNIGRLVLEDSTQYDNIDRIVVENVTPISQDADLADDSTEAAIDQLAGDIMQVQSRQQGSLRFVDDFNSSEVTQNYIINLPPDGGGSHYIGFMDGKLTYLDAPNDGNHGEQGPPGEDGKDGFSPIIVGDVVNTNTFSISITDALGTTPYTLIAPQGPEGRQGIPGTPGEPGTAIVNEDEIIRVGNVALTNGSSTDLPDNVHNGPVNIAASTSGVQSPWRDFDTILYDNQEVLLPHFSLHFEWDLSLPNPINYELRYRIGLGAVSGSTILRDLSTFTEWATLNDREEITFESEGILPTGSFALIIDIQYRTNGFTSALTNFSNFGYRNAIISHTTGAWYAEVAEIARETATDHFSGKYTDLTDFPIPISDITDKHGTATLGQILSKTATGLTYVDPPTGGGGTGGVPLATFNAFTQSTNDSFANLPNQFANLAAYTAFAADTSQDITHLSATVNDFPANYIARTTFDTFQTNQNTHNDSVNRRLTGLTTSVNARVHTDAFNTYTIAVGSDVQSNNNHITSNAARIKVLEDAPSSGGASQAELNALSLTVSGLSRQAAEDEQALDTHTLLADNHFHTIDSEIDALRREVSDQVTIFGKDNIDSSITKGIFVPEIKVETTLISGDQEYESGNPNLSFVPNRNIYDFTNIRFKTGDEMYGEYVPRNASNRNAPGHFLGFTAGLHNESFLGRDKGEIEFGLLSTDPVFDVAGQLNEFEIRGDWHYQYNRTNAPVSTDPRGTVVFNVPSEGFHDDIVFDTGINASYGGRLFVTFNIADGSDINLPPAGRMLLSTDTDSFTQDGDDILRLSNFQLIRKLPPAAVTLSVADKDRDDIYYEDQHLNYRKNLVLNYVEATNRYTIALNPDHTGGMANQSQIGIRSAPLLADFYDSPQTYTTTLNKTEVDKVGTSDASFNSMSMTFRDRLTNNILTNTISAEDLKARVVSASVANIPNTVTIESPKLSSGELQYVPIASINVPNVDSPTSQPHDGLFYGHYQSAANGGNLRIVRRHNSRYILLEAHENRIGSGTVAPANVTLTQSTDGNTLTYNVNGSEDEFAPSSSPVSIAPSNIDWQSLLTREVSVTVPAGYEGLAYRFRTTNTASIDGDTIYLRELTSTFQAIARHSNSALILSARRNGNTITFDNNSVPSLFDIKFVSFLRG